MCLEHFLIKLNKRFQAKQDIIEQRYNIYSCYKKRSIPWIRINFEEKFKIHTAKVAQNFAHTRKLSSLRMLFEWESHKISLQYLFRIIFLRKHLSKLFNILVVLQNCFSVQTIDTHLPSERFIKLIVITFYPKFLLFLTSINILLNTKQINLLILLAHERPFSATRKPQAQMWDL